MALHLEARNALALADELSRYEHALGNDDLAAHLSALRTALGGIERALGKSHQPSEWRPPSPVDVEGAERAAGSLRARSDEVPSALRPRLRALLASVDRVVFGLLRPGESVPAKPLLGVLPLARLVPQGIRSALGYAAAAALLASSRVARTPRAAAAGATLAISSASASLLGDRSLSAAKLLPIEVSEATDLALGMSAVAAPFVLGYVRKDPLSSAIQVAVGLLTCAVSVLTDYRAKKGVTIPVRSRGGPPPTLSTNAEGQLVVPEAQRALEGLSSAGTDWPPESGEPSWPSG